MLGMELYLPNTSCLAASYGQTDHKMKFKVTPSIMQIQPLYVYSTLGIIIISNYTQYVSNRKSTSPVL